MLHEPIYIQTKNKTLILNQIELGIVRKIRISKMDNQPPKKNNVHKLKELFNTNTITIITIFFDTYGYIKNQLLINIVKC